MGKRFYDFLSKTFLIAMLVFMAGTAMPALTSLATSISSSSEVFAAPSGPCSDQDREIHSRGAAIDHVKAISLVTQTNEFTSKIQGYKSAFNSIFTEWQTDPNCNLTLLDIGVAYTLSNETGVVKNVVVELDPALTKVIRLTEQPTGYYSVSSPTWAGYAVYGTSSGSQVQSYEAYATWSQTTNSKPPSGPSCQGYKSCNAATWTGLWDGNGASPHIAQAGTDGKVTCQRVGCNAPYYYGWYEFYPNPFVTCSNFNPSPGDSMSSDVVNEYKNGGSNTVYDITLRDVTKGAVCAVIGYSFPSLTPWFAPFIIERPSICFGFDFCSLAKFTSETIAGSSWYCNPYCGYYSISSSTSRNVEYKMQNGGYTNINNGVISLGRFTETWSTSQGT